MKIPIGFEVRDVTEDEIRAAQVRLLRREETDADRSLLDAVLSWFQQSTQAASPCSCPELAQAIARPLTFSELHSLESRVKRLQDLWRGPMSDLSEIGLLIAVEMPRLIKHAKQSLANGSASLTGGCLLARGGRVLRHGEVIREGDYVVNGGLVNPATPVPSAWVGRRIFKGLPQPSVIRVPNTHTSVPVDDKKTSSS